MRALTSSVVTLLLVAGLATSALADYNPPPQKKGQRTSRRGGTTTTAVRGTACTPKTETSLVAIAPRTHVGATLSDTPTLVWHVPDEKSFLTRVELLAYDASDTDSDKIISLVKEEIPSQQGWMSWTVPESHRLEPGQLYHWRVIMFCNPNRPLESQMVSADLVLGDTTNGLKAELSAATDPVKQAKQLAAAGYWYDSMALLVDLEGEAAATLRREMVQSLLELAQAEPTSRTVDKYVNQLEELLQFAM